MAHTECYPEKAPQINKLLDTLSHHLRREIIHYFENHTEAETATLEEITDHLLHRIPETPRKHVETQLVHNHLPTLAEGGWIEYDSHSKRIRYRGHSRAPRLLDELRVLFSTS